MCSMESVESSLGKDCWQKGVELPRLSVFLGGQMDITYIVKITSNCNMGCSYCYYRNNKPEAETGRMSFETVDVLIDSVLENNNEGAQFIWHGGEPLLMGIDFFEHIVSRQKEKLAALGKELPILNCVQTNGTLLNEAWIDFFERNEFGVSISLDGFYELHSGNRGTSKKVFDKTLGGVKLLSERGMPFSVLTVVTDATIGNEELIFDFFDDCEITSFGFLPMNYGNLEDCISAEKYGDFLCTFFDLWVAKGKTDVKVREFDEFLRGYLGQPLLLCEHCNNCHLYYTVEPDGLVYPCDCFPAKDDVCFGSVYTPIADILDAGLRLFTRANRTPAECERCEFLQICNGGCKHRRWILDNEYRKPEFYCEAYKRLYEKMKGSLVGA